MELLRGTQIFKENGEVTLKCEMVEMVGWAVVGLFPLYNFIVTEFNIEKGVIKSYHMLGDNKANEYKGNFKPTYWV